MINRLIELTDRTDLHRRPGRDDRRPRQAAPRDRLRHPADRPVPAPEDPAQRDDGALLYGESKATAQERAGAARPRRPRPHDLRRPGPHQLRRSAPARGRGPSPRGRPAGAADGRTLRGRRPGGAHPLQEEFLRLQRDLGKTVVLVTHDIDEAVKMGDRVAVFAAGGRLAQFGTPVQLLAHPPTSSSRTSSAPPWAAPADRHAHRPRPPRAARRRHHR